MATMASSGILSYVACFILGGATTGVAVTIGWVMVHRRDLTPEHRRQLFGK